MNDFKNRKMKDTPELNLLEFTFPEKYKSEKEELIHLIKNHQGSCRCSPVEAGIRLAIKFENLRSKNTFKKIIDERYPDLYEY